MQQVSALAKSLGSGKQYEIAAESPQLELMQKSTMHHLNKELHSMAGLPHIGKSGNRALNDDIKSTSDSSDAKGGNSHGFKIETDKVTQPICVQHFGPLDLLAFALVNRQLKLFAVRQTVAKLVFEQRAQIRTEHMAVCMSVNTHKVTERLLVCMGLQCKIIMKCLLC